MKSSGGSWTRQRQQIRVSIRTRWARRFYVNSVLYYAPWIYCCVATAVRLTGSDREDGAGWALPWMCGALTFGVCGVYEMQGPLMQWWEWPAYDTRLAADQR